MADLSRRDLLVAAGTAAWGVSNSGLSGVVPSSRTDGVLTGGARTVRIDGRYDVWVKQVGTGAIPVLTLHGGPGFNHFYLECLEDFLPQADVRFWYYDQLGWGFLDFPGAVSLWELDCSRD